MKKLNRVVLFLCFFFFFSLASYSQINFDLHATGGLNNIVHGLFKQEHRSLANYYTYSSAYSVGASVYIPIQKSRFNIISGIDYVSLESTCHINDDFYERLVNDPIIPYMGLKSWKIKQHALNIPIKTSFSVTNFLSVNAGLNNMIKLDNPFSEQSVLKYNTYTLGATCGFDFYVFSRLILGAEYNRELSRMALLPDGLNKVAYFSQSFNIKIGCLLFKK